MGARVVLAAALVAALPTIAAAQELSAAADLLFYADNTEFANPFREGETWLGAAGRVYVSVALGDEVQVRGGLFGNGRFGAHEFLEEAEPYLALEIRRGPSRLILGSLETALSRVHGRGPDRETPHGLLPPVQEETLTFRRAHDMGLQWLVDGPRLSHDAWLSWHRLNRNGQRELFDAGYRARVALARPLAIAGSWHVVHEGGQADADGPVRDSHAGTLGLVWSAGAATAARITVEAHGVATRDTPDRAQAESTRTGIGVFTRAALDAGPWRGHLIVWRGEQVFKTEGDANYLSARLDGTAFPRIRDYGEAGVTRVFRPAPGVDLQASFRLHRVERHYEYSYRIVSRVRIGA
ncbi:MAG: hypothetical protein AB1635_20110 [Acidobacteriota bacterium]